MPIPVPRPAQRTKRRRAQGTVGVVGTTVGTVGTAASRNAPRTEPLPQEDLKAYQLATTHQRTFSHEDKYESLRQAANEAPPQAPTPTDYPLENAPLHLQQAFLIATAPIMLLQSRTNSAQAPLPEPLPEDEAKAYQLATTHQPPPPTTTTTQPQPGPQPAPQPTRTPLQASTNPQATPTPTPLPAPRLADQEARREQLRNIVSAFEYLESYRTAHTTTQPHPYPSQPQRRPSTPHGPRPRSPEQTRALEYAASRQTAGTTLQPHPHPPPPAREPLNARPPTDEEARRDQMRNIFRAFEYAASSQSAGTTTQPHPHPPPPPPTQDPLHARVPHDAETLISAFNYAVSYKTAGTTTQPHPYPTQPPTREPLNARPPTDEEAHREQMRFIFRALDYAAGTTTQPHPHPPPSLSQDPLQARAPHDPNAPSAFDYISSFRTVETATQPHPHRTPPPPTQPRTPRPPHDVEARRELIRKINYAQQRNIDLNLAQGNRTIWHDAVDMMTEHITRDKTTEKTIIPRAKHLGNSFLSYPFGDLDKVGSDLSNYLGFNETNLTPSDLGYYNTYTPKGSKNKPPPLIMYGHIAGRPELRERTYNNRSSGLSQVIIVEVTYLQFSPSGHAQQVTGRFRMSVRGDYLYRDGEPVRVQGILTEIPVFDGFDYRDFMRRKGVDSMIDGSARPTIVPLHKEELKRRLNDDASTKVVNFAGPTMAQFLRSQATDPLQFPSGGIPQVIDLNQRYASFIDTLGQADPLAATSRITPDEDPSPTQPFIKGLATFYEYTQPFSHLLDLRFANNPYEARDALLKAGAASAVSAFTAGTYRGFRTLYSRLPEPNKQQIAAARHELAVAKFRLRNAKSFNPADVRAATTNFNLKWEAVKNAYSVASDRIVTGQSANQAAQITGQVTRGWRNFWGIRPPADIHTDFTELSIDTTGKLLRSFWNRTGAKLTGIRFPNFHLISTGRHADKALATQIMKNLQATAAGQAPGHASIAYQAFQHGLRNVAALGTTVARQPLRLAAASAGLAYNAYRGFGGYAPFMAGTGALATGTTLFQYAGAGIAATAGTLGGAAATAGSLAIVGGGFALGVGAMGVGIYDLVTTDEGQRNAREIDAYDMNARALGMTREELAQLSPFHRRRIELLTDAPIPIAIPQNPFEGPQPPLYDPDTNLTYSTPLYADDNWSLEFTGAAQQGRTGTVIEVHDGDTVSVRFDGSDKIERVRLLDVDTAETKHPNVPPERWGAEATAFTKQLEGQRVSIEDQGYDRYGRLLGYIHTTAAFGDGESILWNRSLLENGLAEHNDFGEPGKYTEELAEVYQQAKYPGDAALYADAWIPSWLSPSDSSFRGKGEIAQRIRDIERNEPAEGYEDTRQFIESRAEAGITTLEGASLDFATVLEYVSAGLPIGASGAVPDWIERFLTNESISEQIINNLGPGRPRANITPEMIRELRDRVAGMSQEEAIMLTAVYLTGYRYTRGYTDGYVPDNPNIKGYEADIDGYEIQFPDLVESISDQNLRWFVENFTFLNQEVLDAYYEAHEGATGWAMTGTIDLTPPKHLTDPDEIRAQHTRSRTGFNIHPSFDQLFSSFTDYSILSPFHLASQFAPEYIINLLTGTHIGLPPPTPEPFDDPYLEAQIDAQPPELTPQEMKWLAKYDANQSGGVTLAELARYGIKGILPDSPLWPLMEGKTRKGLHGQVYGAPDDNTLYGRMIHDNPNVTVEEIARVAAAATPSENAITRQAVFDLYDVDRSGTLSIKELKGQGVYGVTPDHRLYHYMSDSNNDDKIGDPDSNTAAGNAFLSQELDINAARATLKANAAGEIYKQSAHIQALLDYPAENAPAMVAARLYAERNRDALLARFDLTGDGKITGTELRQFGIQGVTAIQPLYYLLKDAASDYEVGDASRNTAYANAILNNPDATTDEIATMASGRPVSSAAIKKAAIFAKYDYDGNESITLKDLKAAYQAFTGEEKQTFKGVNASHEVYAYMRDPNDDEKIGNADKNPGGAEAWLNADLDLERTEQGFRTGAAQAIYEEAARIQTILQLAQAKPELRAWARRYAEQNEGDLINWFDTNKSGQITIEDLAPYGIRGVQNTHPLYYLMTDSEGDGFIGDLGKNSVAAKLALEQPTLENRTMAKIRTMENAAAAATARANQRPQFILLAIQHRYNTNVGSAYQRKYITRTELKEHGIEGVRIGHPIYEYVNDSNDDGEFGNVKWFDDNQVHLGHEAKAVLDLAYQLEAEWIARQEAPDPPPTPTAPRVRAAPLTNGQKRAFTLLLDRGDGILSKNDLKDKGIYYVPEDHPLFGMFPSDDNDTHFGKKGSNTPAGNQFLRQTKNNIPDTSPVLGIGSLTGEPLDQFSSTFLEANNIPSGDLVKKVPGYLDAAVNLQTAQQATRQRNAPLSVLTYLDAASELEQNIRTLRPLDTPTETIPYTLPQIIRLMQEKNTNDLPQIIQEIQEQAPTSYAGYVPTLDHALAILTRETYSDTPITDTRGILSTSNFHADTGTEKNARYILAHFFGLGSTTSGGNFASDAETLHNERILLAGAALPNAPLADIMTLAELTRPGHDTTSALAGEKAGHTEGYQIHKQFAAKNNLPAITIYVPNSHQIDPQRLKTLTEAQPANIERWMKENGLTRFPKGYGPTGTNELRIYFDEKLGLEDWSKGHTLFSTLAAGENAIFVDPTFIPIWKEKYDDLLGGPPWDRLDYRTDQGSYPTLPPNLPTQHTVIPWPHARSIDEINQTIRHEFDHVLQRLYADTKLEQQSEEETIRQAVNALTWLHRNTGLTIDTTNKTHHEELLNTVIRLTTATPMTDEEISIRARHILNKITSEGQLQNAGTVETTTDPMRREKNIATYAALFGNRPIPDNPIDFLNNKSAVDNFTHFHTFRAVERQEGQRPGSNLDIITLASLDTAPYSELAALTSIRSGAANAPERVANPGTGLLISFHLRNRPLYTIPATGRTPQIEIYATRGLRVTKEEIESLKRAAQQAVPNWMDTRNIQQFPTGFEEGKSIRIVISDLSPSSIGKYKPQNANRGFDAIYIDKEYTDDRYNIIAHELDHWMLHVRGAEVLAGIETEEQLEALLTTALTYLVTETNLKPLPPPSNLHPKYAVAYHRAFDNLPTFPTNRELDSRSMEILRDYDHLYRYGTARITPAATPTPPVDSDQLNTNDPNSPYYPRQTFTDAPTLETAATPTTQYSADPNRADDFLTAAAHVTGALATAPLILHNLRADNLARTTSASLSELHAALGHGVYRGATEQNFYERIAQVELGAAHRPTGLFSSANTAINLALQYIAADPNAFDAPPPDAGPTRLTYWTPTQYLRQPSPYTAWTPTQYLGSTPSRYPVGSAAYRAEQQTLRLAQLTLAVAAQETRTITANEAALHRFGYSAATAFHENIIPALQPYARRALTAQGFDYGLPQEETPHAPIAPPRPDGGRAGPNTGQDIQLLTAAPIALGAAARYFLSSQVATATAEALSIGASSQFAAAATGFTLALPIVSTMYDERDPAQRARRLAVIEASSQQNRQALTTLAAAFGINATNLHPTRPHTREEITAALEAIAPYQTQALAAEEALAFEASQARLPEQRLQRPQPTQQEPTPEQIQQALIETAFATATATGVYGAIDWETLGQSLLAQQERRQAIGQPPNVQQYLLDTYINPTAAAQFTDTFLQTTSQARGSILTPADLALESNQLGAFQTVAGQQQPNVLQYLLDTYLSPTAAAQFTDTFLQTTSQARGSILTPANLALEGNQLGAFQTVAGQQQPNVLQYLLDTYLSPTAAAQFTDTFLQPATRGRGSILTPANLALEGNQIRAFQTVAGQQPNILQYLLDTYLDPTAAAQFTDTFLQPATRGRGSILTPANLALEGNQIRAFQTVAGQQQPNVLQYLLDTYLSPTTAAQFTDTFLQPATRSRGSILTPPDLALEGNQIGAFQTVAGQQQPNVLQYLLDTYLSPAAAQFTDTFLQPDTPTRTASPDAANLALEGNQLGAFQTVAGQQQPNILQYLLDTYIDPTTAAQFTDTFLQPAPQARGSIPTPANLALEGNQIGAFQTVAGQQPNILQYLLDTYLSPTAAAQFTDTFLQTTTRGRGSILTPANLALEGNQIGAFQTVAGQQPNVLQYLLNTYLSPTAAQHFTDTYLQPDAPTRAAAPDAANLALEDNQIRAFQTIAGQQQPNVLQYLLDTYIDPTTAAQFTDTFQQQATQARGAALPDAANPALEDNRIGAFQTVAGQQPNTVQHILDTYLNPTPSPTITRFIDTYLQPLTQTRPSILNPNDIALEANDLNAFIATTGQTIGTLSRFIDTFETAATSPTPNISANRAEHAIENNDLNAFLQAAQTSGQNTAAFMDTYLATNAPAIHTQSAARTDANIKDALENNDLTAFQEAVQTGHQTTAVLLDTYLPSLTRATPTHRQTAQLQANLQAALESNDLGAFSRTAAAAPGTIPLEIDTFLTAPTEARATRAAIETGAAQDPFIDIGINALAQTFSLSTAPTSAPISNDAVDFDKLNRAVSLRESGQSLIAAAGVLEAIDFTVLANAMALELSRTTGATVSETIAQFDFDVLGQALSLAQVGADAAGAAAVFGAIDFDALGQALQLVEAGNAATGAAAVFAAIDFQALAATVALQRNAATVAANTGTFDAAAITATRKRSSAIRPTPLELENNDLGAFLNTIGQSPANIQYLLDTIINPPTETNTRSTLYERAYAAYTNNDLHLFIQIAQQAPARTDQFIDTFLAQAVTTHGAQSKARTDANIQEAFDLNDIQAFTAAVKANPGTTQNLIDTYMPRREDNTRLNPVETQISLRLAFENNDLSAFYNTMEQAPAHVARFVETFLDATTRPREGRIRAPAPTQPAVTEELTYLPAQGLRATVESAATIELQNETAPPTATEQTVEGRASQEYQSKNFVLSIFQNDLARFTESAAALSGTTAAFIDAYESESASAPPPGILRFQEPNLDPADEQIGPTVFQAPIPTRTTTFPPVVTGVTSVPVSGVSAALNQRQRNIQSRGQPPAAPSSPPPPPGPPTPPIIPLDLIRQASRIAQGNYSLEEQLHSNAADALDQYYSDYLDYQKRTGPQPHEEAVEALNSGAPLDDPQIQALLRARASQPTGSPLYNIDNLTEEQKAELLRRYQEALTGQDQGTSNSIPEPYLISLVEKYIIPESFGDIVIHDERTDTEASQSEIRNEPWYEYMMRLVAIAEANGQNVVVTLRDDYFLINTTPYGYSVNPATKQTPRSYNTVDKIAQGDPLDAPNAKRRNRPRLGDPLRTPKRKRKTRSRDLTGLALKL